MKICTECKQPILDHQKVDEVICSEPGRLIHRVCNRRDPEIDTGDQEDREAARHARADHHMQRGDW